LKPFFFWKIKSESLKFKKGSSLVFLKTKP
jgi:hypothetical protein